MDGEEVVTSNGISVKKELISGIEMEAITEFADVLVKTKSVAVEKGNDLTMQSPLISVDSFSKYAA